MHERAIIEKLLTRMRRYSQRTGVPLQKLSKRATGNSEFYDRLSGGGDATTGTVVRVINHMEATKPVEGRGPYSEDAA